MTAPQQLSFDDYTARQAMAARDVGMVEAEFAETMRNPDFSTEATNAIRRVAARQEFLFVDDVIAECKVQPLHFNAWGGCWMRAIRDGIIAPTKERRHSRDPKKHSHEYKVYRSLNTRWRS